MSKYTTQIRFICETAAGLTEQGDFSDIDTAVNAGRSVLFDTEYPIFDETYRSVLETKILKHYYTREIGVETVALFKHFLRTRMNEIMPYYNKLYTSETISFNPLYDFSYTRSYTRDNTENKEATRTDDSTRTDNLTTHTISTADNTKTNNLTTTNTGTVSDDGTDSNTNRFSDTPQGGLNGMQSIENNTYLTNATLDNGTHYNMRAFSNNTGNTGTVTDNGEGEATTGNTGTVDYDNTTTDTHEITNLTEYAETVSGKRGGVSYSKMLMEYRQSMLNIDMMIIKELSDLFMTIY